MKMGFISDLHIDINRDYPVMDLLAQECDRHRLDFLVIAGDISETPGQTIEAVGRLQDQLRQNSSCRVYYVPGNHDMWNKNCPDRETEEIAAAFAADPLCLAGGKLVRAGDACLVGDIGWYDYSFASPDYSLPELESMQIHGRTWQDKLFNSWTRDNAGQLRQSCRQLADTMERAALEWGEKAPLIAVTHMLPIRDFTVPQTQGDWGFFNAFLGAEAIGQLLRKYPVRLAVCGHVHYRKTLDWGGIRWICPCLGYHSEWPLYELEDDEAQTHIADALQIVEF